MDTNNKCRVKMGKKRISFHRAVGGDKDAASVWSLYHKVLIGGVLQRWLSFWKVLPSPQRNCRALSVTIGILVPSQPKVLLPQLLSLARWPALGRVLGGSKLLPRMMEATVFLGTLNDVKNNWYPSTDLCLDTILSRSSTDNSFNLMHWLLLWHALNCGTLYTQMCAFPNIVQSIECTTGGLQSTCRNISRMINGNTWAQFRVS